MGAIKNFNRKAENEKHELTSKRCFHCQFVGSLGTDNFAICQYNLRMFHRRGCEAGSKCTEFRLASREQVWYNYKTLKLWG